MTRFNFKGLVIFSALAACCACSSSSDTGGGGGGGTDDELIGAGDRNVSQFWLDIDVPYSQNTKVLSFSMLRNEVLRATGKSWVVDGVDVWDANKSVLGQNATSVDRTMSQQKLVTIRKMAFAVCEDLVENDTDNVFDVLVPTEGLNVNNPKIREQLQSLYKRFFLTDPSAADLDESMSLTLDLNADVGASSAWKGVCTAYLSSMRFLSY